MIYKIIPKRHLLRASYEIYGQNDVLIANTESKGQKTIFRHITNNNKLAVIESQSFFRKVYQIYNQKDDSLTLRSISNFLNYRKYPIIVNDDFDLINVSNQFDDNFAFAVFYKYNTTPIAGVKINNSKQNTEYILEIESLENIAVDPFDLITSLFGITTVLGKIYS